MSGRAGRIIRGFGVVQPPVQMVELVVQLASEPVRGRDGDAELTQRLDAQTDRLHKTVPEGEAAHLLVRCGRSSPADEARAPSTDIGDGRAPPWTAPARLAAVLASPLAIEAIQSLL